MKNTVSRYLEDIRRRGDRAVAGLMRRFDGVSVPPRRWRVAAEAPRRALRDLPPERRRALEASARNIRFFHVAEKRHGPRSWRVSAGGRTLGQEVRPVAAAGLYVPGGRFAYPSTVLMTAIPASVAGVRRIVVATPPRHLTPEVLAACALAGVHEIYALGGVAAIGALAFGTATIPAVDLIAGPGGAWVTEAKRQVFGVVGVDMLAGPSEIAVVVDGSVPASFVAADLMAQAEHDPLARAVLISTDARALAAVRAAVAPGFRAQCDFVKVPTRAAAARAASARAAEHLSLAVRNPAALLKEIPNAGAAFLGPWSPVAIGDYWAGPSHVLPTGRSARFASGLSVQTFLKRTSVLDLSRSALRAGRRDAALVAEAEGLTHHARSLEARFSK